MDIIFLDEIPHYQSDEILSIVNDNITEKNNDCESKLGSLS